LFDSYALLIPKDSDYHIHMIEFQVDWDGYTIGYYGRIFEARNKTKGGSFEVDIVVWRMLLFV